MNAPLQFQIHTHDHGAAHAIFGATIETGQQAVIGEGIEAEYQYVEKRYSVGWPDIVAFVVTASAAIPPSVVANLISTWLLSKFPKKPEKVIIDRTEVEFEEGELKRVITERIEKFHG